MENLVTKLLIYILFHYRYKVSENKSISYKDLKKYIYVDDTSVSC